MTVWLDSYYFRQPKIRYPTSYSVVFTKFRYSTVYIIIKKELSILLIVCYCWFRRANKVIKSGGGCISPFTINLIAHSHIISWIACDNASIDQLTCPKQTWKASVGIIIIFLLWYIYPQLEHLNLGTPQASRIGLSLTGIYLNLGSCRQLLFCGFQGIQIHFSG